MALVADERDPEGAAFLLPEPVPDALALPLLARTGR